MPSSLGLGAAGAAGLPAALRRLGIAERLSARDGGVVECGPASGVRDPTSGVLNADALGSCARALAEIVESAVGRGEFPVVLAGDCSVLLGAMLGLRRLALRDGEAPRRRFGLLFLDGHVDFYQPGASPTGEAADMDLALVTGHGPPALGDIDGLGPYVAEADVVAFGARDATERAEARSQDVRATEVRVVELHDVRARGIEAAAEAAVAHLESRGLAGCWIHIDADVLDDRVMPAVDYRQPGGLSPGELALVLGRAMETGLPVGASVAIYDPSLDPGGDAGRVLVRAVTEGLR